MHHDPLPRLEAAYTELQAEETHLRTLSYSCDLTSCLETILTIASRSSSFRSPSVAKTPSSLVHMVCLLQAPGPCEGCMSEVIEEVC